MARIRGSVPPETPSRPGRPTRPLSDQIQARARRLVTVKEEEDTHFDPSRFLSSGSTLLNLALTDNPFCGWQKGKMVNIIGDSSSGKTVLTLTSFAELTINSEFDDYRLIMDDAEHANEFNLSKLFGRKVADRIEAPNTLHDEDLPSELIEDFHSNIRRALKEKQSFLYVLDSMDALDSEADQKKIEEHHAAREKKQKALEEGKELKGKDPAGSYGMAKAKKNSEILRDVVGRLEKSDSILLIISQTRDNIDPMSFATKTRSGGKALKFYATHELWTASGGVLKSKDRVIGVTCKVKVSKNKITGKVREVEFPIYYDYGIDDIGSMIDWLLDEKIWTGGGKEKINPRCDKAGRNGDLGLEPGTRNALIKDIEADDLVDDLRRLVGEEWNKVEDSLKLKRKSRYE